MKSARLIKRHEIEDRDSTPRNLSMRQPPHKTGAVESVRTWVSERQNRRPGNPRAEFVALFRQAAWPVLHIFSPWGPLICRRP